MNRKTILSVLVFFVLAKFLFHFFTLDLWGFHRDEYLYLAQGLNLDWGFWSNPPFTGFMSWVAQSIWNNPNDLISVAEFRTMPMLFAIATLILTLGMVRDFGGQLPALIIAGIGLMVAPGILRPGMMFNPIIFEIFFWTLFSWFIIRYLNTSNKNYLLGLGVAIGVGLLNKYSVAFYAIGVLVALLATPHRKLFQSKWFYAALSFAFVIFLPNLIWQIQHDFPVFFHMNELAENQLVNVSFASFLGDQVLMYLPVLFVWLSGLIWLLWSEKGKPFRALGLIALTIYVLLIVLKGKGYYTLGIYPMLLAAGAVRLDEWFVSKRWRWVWGFLMLKSLVIGWFFLPFSAPVLPLDEMVAFCEKVETDYGLDAPMRWEDGEIHHLPQDYADMIGWNELAEKTRIAYQKYGCTPQNSLVYAENFGEVGAIAHYNQDLFKPVSFADAFLLWAPATIPATVHIFIYVNDELGEDVAALFETVEVAGRIENERAREFGTTVFVCQQPRVSFKDFWEARVRNGN